MPTKKRRVTLTSEGLFRLIHEDGEVFGRQVESMIDAHSWRAVTSRVYNEKMVGGKGDNTGNEGRTVKAPKVPNLKTGLALNPESSGQIPRNEVRGGTHARCEDVVLRPQAPFKEASLDLLLERRCPVHFSKLCKTFAASIGVNATSSKP